MGKSTDAVTCEVNMSRVLPAITCVLVWHAYWERISSRSTNCARAQQIGRTRMCSSVLIAENLGLPQLTSEHPFADVKFLSCSLRLTCRVWGFSV